MHTTLLGFLASAVLLAIVGSCGDDDVASRGEACGGFAVSQCAPDLYCDFPDQGCGIADGSGTCEERPALCSGEVAPVCGCDSERYTNACEASRAGVDVGNPGSCGLGAAPAR
jgi:hypothetical protein